EVHGVEIDGGEAGDQQLATRGRRLPADVPYELTRLIAVQLVRGHDVEEHDVLPNGLPQRGLKLGRQLLARQRIDRREVGQLTAEEAGIDRERALHLDDAGKLRKSRAKFLELWHARAIE